MIPMNINSQVEKLIKKSLEAEEEKQRKIHKKRKWLKETESTILTIVNDKLNGRVGNC